MLCNAGESKEREKEYLFMLQCNKDDGIIIASHTLDLDDYSKISLPVVGLDRFLGSNIPTVSSDHEQGGRFAAEELIRCGCKKVIQIKGYSAVQTPSNERHVVFRKVMEENNIVCHDFELPLNVFRFMEYLDFTRDVFANEPGIDGLFAADNIACAACKIAPSMGIRIPEQLKVIGYDGTELSLMSQLSLSTIVQPIRKIAQTTVNVLLSLMLQPDIAKTPLSNKSLICVLRCMPYIKTEKIFRHTSLYLITAWSPEGLSRFRLLCRVI